MSILPLIQSCFRPALEPITDDVDAALELIRRTDNPQHGDYQANFAMPLAAKVGRPSREVAQQIVDALDVSEFCQPPEIAGPGFINLRLKNGWVKGRLAEALPDERLSVKTAKAPLTYVVDFSSPNIAKPLHVGHIRSTIIGDSISRILRFLGHKVITDNHLGDWGTQFGMVIYGYKHLRDEKAYQQNPVNELARLYKLVRALIDYHDAKSRLPEAENRLSLAQAALEEFQASPTPEDKSAKKKAKKQQKELNKAVEEASDALAGLRVKIAAVETNQDLKATAEAHPDVGAAVLRETAALHAGDPENYKLWEEFLPKCRQGIQPVYDRLAIEFDVEHGESFYHDMLPGVVESLHAKGIARESDGAMCVFLEGFDTPMIVQKRDGAYLYATTDLATIRHRLQTYHPEAILYVVDHRQGQHFQMLFAAARQWGCEQVDLRHVSFGTVLGEDGRPFQTRAGETVGLEGLLDEAEERAYQTVTEVDQAKPNGPELTDEQRREIAPVVGIGGLKYADLSQNRTSDYKFSYKKMLALDGNTATYVQYAYARNRSIFRRGDVDPGALARQQVDISLDHPSERALALELLRLADVLDAAVSDFRPNLLTDYLFTLAKTYNSFFRDCHVLNAETDELRQSRLALCDLTSRTIEKGLNLLGIGVVEKM